MASSFDETFDYLTMLGLDPATVRRLDAAGLRDVIKGKKKEWTGQAINPLYQQAARANLERAKHFEQILRDPAALEAYVSFMQEVQAANRRQQELEAGRLVSLAVGDKKKGLTTGQRDLILKEAKARDLPAELVEEVIRTRGLAIQESPAAVAAVKLPYKEPAMDRTLLAQINKHLHVLDKKSFYELLDLPVRTSPGKLASVSQILYSKWSKSLPKTIECVAWEKSLQACMTYLKDEDCKDRYDRALFNARLDEFLWRIDLVLAGGKLTRESHVQLAQAGVQEFGLTQAAVNQCISLQAAAKGVPLSKPVLVTVKLEGQAQCARCFHWNPGAQARCIQCGASLIQRCRNPFCGKSLPGTAKVCDHCQLPAAKGGQFAALVQLIDASISTGNARTALDGCRLALQIHPIPAIEERSQRAGQVRVLSATIKRAAADSQWTKVLQDLPRLLLLSPQLSQPGIPQIEKVTEFVGQVRQRLLQLPESAGPAAAARLCLELLAQWTDCPELIEKLHAISVALETRGDFDAALEAAGKLLELEPTNEEYQAQSVQLQHKVAHAREQATRRDQALKAWHRALAENRLYAAERAFQTLEELEATAGLEADAAALRQQLAEIRGEIQEIKQSPPADLTRDALIARYLALLQRCRDCREALAALQSASPAPPSPPRRIQVTASGNRRLIAWEPPESGKTPTAYVLQRSMIRPGSRQPEQPYVTIYDGPAVHHVDDEIAHSGTIVRYTVHAVLRGRLEIEGNVLQEYAANSPPVFADPFLVWQEVLGLRSTRLAGGLEMRWHQPAGVRQVLIERWPGGRDDRPEKPALLAANGDGRLVDRELAVEPSFTYRLCCVYDGPQGDFVTPGVTITDAPLPPGAVETAPEEMSLDEQGVADILKNAPEQAPPESKADRGPLKRFGLWPPVRSSE